MPTDHDHPERNAPLPRGCARPALVELAVTDADDGTYAESFATIARGATHTTRIALLLGGRRGRRSHGTPAPASGEIAFDIEAAPSDPHAERVVAARNLLAYLEGGATPPSVKPEHREWEAPARTHTGVGPSATMHLGAQSWYRALHAIARELASPQRGNYLFEGAAACLAPHDAQPALVAYRGPTLARALLDPCTHTPAPISGQWTCTRDALPDRGKTLATEILIPRHALDANATIHAHIERARTQAHVTLSHHDRLRVRIALCPQIAIETTTITEKLIADWRALIGIGAQAAQAHTKATVDTAHLKRIARELAPWDDPHRDPATHALIARTTGGTLRVHQVADPERPVTTPAGAVRIHWRAWTEIAGAAAHSAEHCTVRTLAEPTRLEIATAHAVWVACDQAPPRDARDQGDRAPCS